MTPREKGFTLIEAMVGLLITMLVMEAVFGLLDGAQRSYRREREIAALVRNTRAGLKSISRDLVMAGYKTPPAIAVFWHDGEGFSPDEITIVYADSNVPTALPDKSAAGSTIKASSTLFLDSATLDPRLADPSQAYPDGMTLFAIETDDCNGDGQVGFHAFELTQPSRCTNAGGARGDTSRCATLSVNHNPADVSDLNMPGGFNGEVQANCAVVGFFRVIQYRINSSSHPRNPVLERREIGTGGQWIPVAQNIENLVVQYGVGSSDNFVDAPNRMPDPRDPETWITRVSVRVTGRTDSTNLQGYSPGDFAEAAPYLRTTFSTITALRNQMGSGVKNE